MNGKYDGDQVGLPSMVYMFFDKNVRSETEPIANE